MKQNPGRPLDPPQIICKFTSRRAKNNFYYIKANLKGKEEFKGIFISEDLTRARYLLLKECKNAEGFKFVTTREGRIKVYLIGKDAPITVTKPADLAKLKLFNF